MWAISTRMDPVRDVTLVENTPIDYLDFASPESGLGGKIGLDANDQAAAGDQARVGHPDPHDRRGDRGKSRANGRVTACRAAAKPIWK